MQVNYEKTGPCAAKVTFQVPKADFDKEITKALKNLGRGARMKGFRPGKVPLGVIERQYGQQVRQEAMQFFMQQAYNQAVQENDLKPIGFQRIPFEDLSMGDDGSFGHHIEINLRPEIELGQYKSIEVDSAVTETTDEEIDAALLDVRRQRARPEAAGDDGTPEDGMVLCKCEWIVDDETILDRDGLRLSPVDPVPGVDADKYKEAMVGSKDGDVLELELKVPEEFEKEEMRGKDGTCRLTVTQAFRIEMPEDKEIFELFEVESEDQLKDAARIKIDEAKAEQDEKRIEAMLIDKIVEAHPMDLPERMIEEQTEARLNQMKQQMVQQGAPEDKVDEDAEQHRDEARDAAVKGMRSLFLMQTIAEKEELLVSSEDMLGEFDSIAERNQTTREEVQKYYEENKMIDQMALEILERKVRAFLRDNAVVNQSA